MLSMLALLEFSSLPWKQVVLFIPILCLRKLRFRGQVSQVVQLVGDTEKIQTEIFLNYRAQVLKEPFHFHHRALKCLDSR